MNDFDMNNFGTPSDGVEEFRKRFYGELARGSEASKPTGGVEVRRDGTPHETPDYLRNTTADGMLIFDAGGNASISSGYSGMMVGEDTTPSLDSVTSTPTDWTAGISRQMEAERKMRRTVAHLRSLVLFDKDFAFQSDLEINRPDLMWLADDSVRADRAGFNMLLGGELSRAISGGNTFGLLEQTIAAMPREEQLAAKGRMQQCDTESKAKELLGELWSGLIIKDYEAQKAELDKRNADRKAALDELKGVMSRDWLTAVMEGHEDIPWQLRHVANMERAGLNTETIKNMRATHRRAKDAWGKLMGWMYGTSYTQAKANARAKGEELMRDWDNTWHIYDRPSEADFYQQGAAELSESFDMSREQMAELLLTLTNDDGQLDEQAMALFLQALEKEAKSNQTVIYSKFWRNFGEAVADWARETGDWLGRNHLKSVSDFGSYIDESGQVHFVDEATRRRASAELAAHYSPQAEALKGYLTRFDDMRVEPSERRLDYMTDMLTKFGTTTGDSAPMMVANIAIPGVGGVIGGGALMFPALTNEAIARNYAMGATNPELLSVIEGGWEAATETMFSVYGGGMVSKGLRSLGADKLMGTAAIKTLGIKGIGKAVGAAWGNGFARYLGNVAFETFGEIVVEETVAETGTYATVQGLRALGVDLDDREWAPFKSTLQILDDPGQTGAMIAYCAVLGLLGVPGNMRAARQFAADRRMLLQVGLTEEGIAEVQQVLRKSEAQVSKVLADAQTQKRLAELRAAAEAKAVEEAEAEAGRPLAEEEVAEAKKKAGDKAVAEETERIITEAQKPLTEKMRAVYLRDVQNHDPVALKKRMEERGKKFLEDVETQLYAESGVMEHTLRRAGIVVGERTPEGLYKVNLPGAKEGETHEVEWTEEQLMAYVAMQRGSDVVKSMRQLQARVAGEALAEADKSLHGEMVDLSVLPVKALARMERNGGSVDYAVLKDLAEDARDKIGGFVTAGMSWTEASAQLSEIPGVTLGTLVNTAEGFVKRVDEAFATGEAQELGLKKPEDAATNVFRVNKAGSAGQSILLYNRGRMNEREFVEDHIERDVVAAVEGENATTSWEALEAMLKRVDGEMVKNGGKRLFKKGATGRASVIEAFSKLAQSYFLLNHGKYDMSAEAHATIEYVHKQLADAQYLMTLSHAWDAFAQSKAGKEYMQKEGASLEKLLSDAGASVAGKYAAAKFDADAVAVVLEAYEGSRRPSPEAAKPVLEQYEKEMEELDHPEAEGEPVVVEAQESITGEQLVLEDEPMVDEATGEFEAPPGAEVQQDTDMKGRGLVDGKYVLMEGGSVYGVAEVDSIELSEDVPQFKKKDSAAGRVEADADGTTHELAGGWNANSAPIHVWRRVDGRLEIISGRHRLAHAKKNGVKHIAVRVYDEAEGLDAAWAKLHDVEQNILDNTCNAIDVAYYFRHNPMTLGEAEARGLMPKTKQGEQTAASRIGLYVAANASEETFAMMVNGRCTAEDAYMACIVASSAEGQQLALETRAGTKGKKNSWEYVTALVRGAEQMQPADAGMLDLFGNDTAFREQSEKIARYVAAVRAGLKSQLNVLQSAGRLNKKGAVSKSLGVSVKTPKDMSRLIERLALLDAAYERLDYELGIPAKVDAWDGKSAVPTKLDELDPGKLYVAKDVANGDVSYSIIGPKAQTWDKYADRAFRGRDDWMLRAEIDASKAKLKADVLRGIGGERLSMRVADAEGRMRAMYQRWLELDALIEEVYYAEDEAGVSAEKKAEAGRAMDEYTDLSGEVQADWADMLKRSGVDMQAYERLDSGMQLALKSAYAESMATGEVRADLAAELDYMSVVGHEFALEDVLDYEELYEAYPQLRRAGVYFRQLGYGMWGYATQDGEVTLAADLLQKEEAMRSTLLHEVQHVIQLIEGFARGGDEYSARIAANNKRRYPFTEWIDGKSDYELYLRLAGEIEARNVQGRMDMTAAERAQKPFNETLEYRGEALVTFSLASQERAQRIARGFHDVEGMAAVEVSVPDVYVKDTAKARNAIKAAYDELRKKPVIMQDGSDVRFTGSGLREIKNHSADRRVLSAIVKMRELSAVAKYIDSAPNTQKHIPAKRNIERFHYYLSKGNFPEYKQWEVSNGRTAGDSGDAYVLIVVAEDNNGNKFYDLDATDVEDVEANKGVSEYLEATRVPNAGRQDSSTPKGRIHRIKEYVNYIDSLNGNFAGNNETADTSFSLASETAQGLFEDGVMSAENAVVVAPSFSISAMHVSPHSFRKFSTDYMGTGEGAQVYGWGLYFMTSTGVNRAYHNQFSRAYRDRYTNRINGERVSDEQAIEMIPGLSETAHPSNLLNALRRHDVKRSFVPVVQAVIKEWSGYRASRESVRKDYVEYLPKDKERLERNIANFSDRTKKKKRKEHEEHVARMLRGFDEDIARLGDDLKALEKVLAWAKAGNKLEYKLGGAVHNYRVELNVEDSNLLDWDKPCVTPELREALKELGISDKAGEFNFRYSTGEYVYKELVGHFGEKKAASEWLAALGYKGVKYLDGFSRRKGKGTYNYVVFSGEDVKITAVQSREEWSLRAGWKKYEDETATFSLGMTAEMADIKAAAEAAGTFMKAPNGKPSKLNAVQWMQVRTKVFKRWFGDWENDPANASRVVDENGEPKVVYHGARHAGFRVFDNEEGERRSDAPDGTSFFSSSYGVAASYTPENGEPDLLDESLQEEIEEYGIEDFAGGIYPVFLNIREPYTINFKDRGWQDDKAFYTLQDENGDYIQPLNGDEYYDSEDEARERAEALGLEEYEIYPEYKDTNSVTQEALDMGADGAIIENVIDEGSYGYGGISATDYVIFDSTQVKSATQNRGTFDGGNADITYSIIGPKAQTWDEYADRAFVGRDDGMMRAEIDASGAVLKARMKPESLYKHEVQKARRMLEDGAYYSAEYDRMNSARRLANVVDSDLMTGGKLRDSDLWKNLQSFICSGKEPLKFLAEFGLSEESQWNDILRAREQTAEEFREAQWQLAESVGVGRESFNIAYENMFGERHDSELHVRTPNDWEGLGDTLGDILDYPELYAAYPELRNVRMRYKPGYVSYGRMPRGKGIEAAEIILGTDKTEEQMRGTLMHEVQHIIQMHEDFAFGGTSSSVRAIFSVLGRLNELGELEAAGTDYKRLSGEIEARGVANRQFMSLGERLARPFNETLEYPGEALTYRLSEYYEAVAKGDATFSIIGPRALTWDRYADQAFKGRDDGKLRAEIDSSRARVKDGVFGFDKVKVYRQLIADWGQLPEDERLAVLNYVDLHDEYRSARIAWRDSGGAEDAEAAMRVKRDAAEAAKPAAVAAMESWFAQRGVRLGEEISDHDTMVKLAESFWYGNADSVVELALISRDNTARLGDVLDYAELYEAYPWLAEMEVVVRDLGGSYLGLASVYGPGYDHIVMDVSLLGDWKRFRSVLLHEVQHAVQRIEGYARGGNKESVYRHVKDVLEYNDWEMKMLARELRWLSGLDSAKDYLKSARRLLKYPNAWKYNGLRYKHWRASLDGSDVARLMVDDIAGMYEELRQADVVETANRNHVIRESEYVLPEVDFRDISGIERGLAALEVLKPRRSAFRGEAPMKDKRYAELLKYTQAAKRMLDKYKLEPYELYVRLAGEIEARNVQARMDMTAKERAKRPFNETLEYPGEALVTFSLASQREIVDRLKGDKELGGFMGAVDKVERMRERKFKQTDIKLGVLSDESLNRLLQQNPGWPDSYDLRNAEHVINETDIWHIYRGHCLDYYLKDDGLNLTYDDIRMIPDILQNYDTITPDYKDGRWGVVYEKNYGGVEYRYSAYISKPHRRSGEPQTVHLTTGWLIKKAVAGDGLTPQQPQATSASRFHRTAIVTPMEEYIKQNYAEEAKNIALIAKNKSNALHAPNGKITNLTPVQWLAVRLQSFKAWFGDWENDPANASKVVDENGEPMVVYHGSPHYGFTVFDKSRRGERDKGDFGRGFYFTPNRGYAATYGKEGYWNAEGDDSKVYACFLNIREPMQVQARQAENMERWRFEDEEGVMVYTDRFYDLAWNDVINLSEIVVHDSTQIKSATDNRGTFDGGNADITYSLSGPSILDAAPTGRIAGEEKMQRLLNYARKEAARWGRTFSKETPNAKAAEAMGTVSSLLASIHKELPPMYRPRVESHLRYVEVYARLIESGKIRTYGKLSKEQRAEVEAELMEVLREEQQRVDAEYEQAKAEALQAAALTGEMAALEEAEKMDVEDEVQRAAYLERVAKRAEAEARKRLLAEAEAKKKQLDAEVEALKREFGAEKLGAIAKRMLTDAANSVERYLIDEELATVPKLLERLAPKKLPNGKYDKGRMSADGYRKFVRYVEMIDSTAEEVAERMEALGLQIAAEEAKSDAEGNADTLEALQAELAEWSTYGNLRGKQLEAVRAGVRALADFAAYEKNAWSSMLQLKRERVKRLALRAADALGGADEHKVKAVKEKERRLVSMLGNLGASMKNLGQMLYGLGGVPELRAIADESLDVLSAGHVALTLREKRAYEQLAEYMKSIGLDTENKRNDWMAALKKLHDTGISKAGELVHHRLKLDPKDAAMWLSMTKEERDAKRAELEADAEGRGVLPENVPYEEDIPLLESELKRYNEKPEGRKWIQTEREFRREGVAETMKLSKDEALNILLLCEQQDYLEAANENGYTDEVLEALREFVGADVLGFGYAMREVLENSGLAEVYEAREGVPFPKVANYWPGNFDQSARANEQANALDPTSGNGTRYGMLITRVKHKLKFNILGASNVFMAALAQQNNYIVVGELTAKWRGLLSHSDFAMSLRQYMGDAEFRQLKELINLLDGAGVQESITQQTLSGLMGQMQSAHAMAVLAGSPVTLVKQVSAMLNAGAWQGVSMTRVLARIVLDRFEKGAIRYDEMLKKDYFQARYKDNRYFTEMLQMGNDANWSRLSKWARYGLRWIEKMDVLTNCASMTALYNITYVDLKKRNEDAVDPLTEDEIREECDRAVRNALELGAQPLRRTQKSAFAALSRNALVRMTCYMSSEAINKLGMTMAIRRRTGGGFKGLVKAWKYLAGISLAQQIVVMCLDMARGAAPNDDDEWVWWLLLNLATGAIGLGVLQSIPLVGEAVQKMTGGYVKTGSLGQMVYDFEGAWRSGKKVVGMAGDDKEESWQDWAWAIGNLFRHMTFTTGLWKGVNASSKVLSELSGLLQSLNAVFNMVRPVVQAVRNKEKKEKKFRKKMEKAFAEGRKKTNERLKKQREEAKKKKEAEKKRKERLKRL